MVEAYRTDRGLQPDLGIPLRRSLLESDYLKIVEAIHAQRRSLLHTDNFHLPTGLGHEQPPSAVCN
ncbi:MAG: hypothetical protein AUI36_32785 [Cyanobacteria bacterium 13_1_40CM_2_61_4]|nr:MAG: hypothetical protein AUI36_32785 [Cyanobacteria bacterium 13_1_40CM_2_61_4]